MKYISLELQGQKRDRDINLEVICFQTVIVAMDMDDATKKESWEGRALDSILSNANI